MFKTYYTLTKPGIIYGNLITTAAGFFLASKGNINFGLLLATLAGVSLVIGSACVFNNYLDRDIDAKMARTKIRALATGIIPIRNAITFATLLGLAGFLLLTKYTNILTAFIGVLAFFDYVILYGISKRRSVHGTLVGSISGAAPVVAGYTSVTNQIDLAAILLFLIMVFWQMPHFYAIAIYRLKDYANAAIPVLPVKKGIHFTKINMVFYIVAFILAALSLTIFGYTRHTYFVVAAVLGLSWLGLCLSGFKTDKLPRPERPRYSPQVYMSEQILPVLGSMYSRTRIHPRRAGCSASEYKDTIWARKMFRFSLITITGLSIMISLDAVR